MKRSARSYLARCPIHLLVAVALFLVMRPDAAMAQATPNPPDRLTYQGYLADANGNPLGAGAPQNYDVIFRIWNDQNSTDASHRLWAEQQTVTVDKGYFSVLLGEGSQFNGEPRPDLPTLFAMPDASDRYVEVTVKGIGSGGSDVVIQPRLRLLTSPYSFLAQTAINANTADTASEVDGAALTSGTVPDARLSGNVARLDADQSFTGKNSFMNTLGIGVVNPTTLLEIQGNGNGDPVGITQNQVGGGNTMELTTADDAGNQASRLVLRGGNDASDIEFYTGGRGSESETMHIEGNSRNVGIGTKSPGARLEVSTPGSLNTILDGSGVSGTWLDLHNSRSGGQHWHLISTGPGNSEGAGKLLFAAGTAPGGTSGDVLTLTPRSGSTPGRVGIGTSNPQAALQVVGGAIMPAFGNGTSSGIYFPPNPGGGSGDNAYIRYIIRSAPEATSLVIGVGNDPENTDDNDNIALKASGTITVGEDTRETGVKLAVNGNVLVKGFVSDYSDRRFKKDITDLNDPLAAILALHGVSFDWRCDEFPERNFTTGRQLGFIAQEVEKVLPQVVSKDAQGYCAVNYSGVIPVLVEAMKQQQQELGAKDSEIHALQKQVSKLDALSGEVTALKKQLAAQQTAATQRQARERAQAVRLEKLEALVNRLNPPVQQASLH